MTDDAELNALRKFFALMERRASTPGGQVPHEFTAAASQAGLLRGDGPRTIGYARGAHGLTPLGHSALNLGQAHLLIDEATNGGARDGV